MVFLLTGGEKIMKGRTKCPKCKHEFVLDAPEGQKKYNVTCPNCNHKFNVKPTSCDPELKDDCLWEEYGEPRKTILSSIKPKTDKPVIASVILFIVFIIGISTAAFPNIFIETPLNTISNAGIMGNIEFSLIDQSSRTLNLGNISIRLNDEYDLINSSNGSYYINNVNLGINDLVISHPGYKTLNSEVLVLPYITSNYALTMERGFGVKYINFDSTGYSAIIVFFSLFALIGCFLAFKRKYPNATIFTAFLGIFSIGFFLIGSILSIIALSLIIRSTKEFEDGKKGKIF